MKKVIKTFIINVNYKYEVFMFEFGDTFYSRLEFILKFQNVPKVDFYNKLNITRQAVVNWKKGSLPSAAVINEMGKFLDVSVDWLITGINYQDSSKSNSPAQIYNRIIYELESLSSSKIYEEKPNFYMPLKDVVSQKMLFKWFYGIQVPDIKTLCNIAELFNWSLDYLINGKNKDLDHDFSLNEGQKNFLKAYTCLSNDNVNIVNRVNYALFIQQVYDKKREAENLENDKIYREYDPFKDDE